ncbi:MAG TPA: PilZ domain-containing protein [Azospirillaceae bacterium]|nr:PilZ domain-containing protein [Azospirillaceae bacterium]
MGEAENESDRRRHPRRPIGEGALVAVGDQVLVARGVDVSDGGACIEVGAESVAKPGDPCTVAIPGIAGPAPATVVATAGNRLHLRYSKD